VSGKTKKVKAKKRYRNAGSGRFILQSEAERNPKQTVSETLKKKRRGK
jgi:hypothetical protein